MKNKKESLFNRFMKLFCLGGIGGMVAIGGFWMYMDIGFGIVFSIFIGGFLSAMVNVMILYNVYSNAQKHP